MASPPLAVTVLQQGRKKERGGSSPNLKSLPVFEPRQQIVRGFQRCHPPHLRVLNGQSDGTPSPSTEAVRLTDLLGGHFPRNASLCDLRPITFRSLPFL